LPFPPAMALCGSGRRRERCRAQGGKVADAGGEAEARCQL